jgi:hypothetical protein
MPKFAKIGIIAALKKPDKETQEAVFALCDVIGAWLVNPTPTGDKIRVQTGVDADNKPITKEIAEVSTPLDTVGYRIARSVMASYAGGLGGSKNKRSPAMESAIIADLQNPNSPLYSSLAQNFPGALQLAGQSGGFADLLNAVERLMRMPVIGPSIQKYIEGKLQFR